MCDPWVELDSIIRHQGDHAEVEKEKAEVLGWKTRAETAERDARAWQEKTKKLVEAVKEEREMRETSFNELQKEKNAVEERCSQLEVKMLKLIDALKAEKNKLSSSGSQIILPHSNDNSELVLDMEKKLKETNEAAEKTQLELARSQERVSLLEGKVRQLVETIKSERENNQKSGIESQKIEIDLLKKKLTEVTQREQALQTEIARLKEAQSVQSPSSNQEAEKKIKELEDRLLKIAVAVRKEREVKAKEIQDLKSDNDKVTNLLKLHQDKLGALEKELSDRGSSNANSALQEEVTMWKRKAEEADLRANAAEKSAEHKINEYKAKVKQIIIQQDAKHKQQLSSAGSGIHSAPSTIGVSEKRVQELEQQIRVLEQRNQALEAQFSAPTAWASAHLPTPSSMGAPPPPPQAPVAPPVIAGAPPPPPPPAPSGSVGGRAGAPLSMMDAIKQGAQLKKTPTQQKPPAEKPKPSGTGPNLAQMAAELANQRRQRMLNGGGNNRGFRSAHPKKSWRQIRKMAY